jgi:hypothetical protein
MIILRIYTLFNKEPVEKLQKETEFLLLRVKMA